MAGQRELAREVRTGLTLIEGKKNSSKEVDPLDVLSYRKPIRQHVKEFGALFATIFLGIAAFQIYRGKPPLMPSIFISLAAVFAFLGYKAPAVLHPLWKAWMKFAQILGGVMTVLILAVAWTLVLIPVSIIMRIVRVKVMKMGFRENVETYWEDRNEKLHDFKLLDRQF